MTVLVTGADGFIGSHLTEKLIREGFKVKAFTLYNSINSWGWLDYCDPDIRGEFEVFSGDIRDSNGVREAMKGCDSVLHLAALVGIPYSYHSPQMYVDTNIGGTLNVLQAAKDLEVSRIIHTSTSEVYGSAQYVPINEKHPLKGQSPYSATKIGADQLAFSFYTSFNLPVVTLRPFNTYGPRQSARAIIPTIALQLGSESSELRLGDITPTRDFSFVDDTVSAFVTVLKASNGIGQLFNVGSNFEISIEETVNVISDVMGIEANIQQDSERVRPVLSEVRRLWACTDKLKDTFAWEPKFSGLEGFKLGIRETVKWFSNPENIKNYKATLYNV